MSFTSNIFVLLFIIMLDPIVDMLNRIRNAQAVHHQIVEVPFSKMKMKIAEILEREGFVNFVKLRKKRGKKIINIELKYTQDGMPWISGLRRVSKFGRRVYRKSEELKKIKGGLGISIVSTSEGIMTAKEAKRKKVGGEVLVEIW